MKMHQRTDHLQKQLDGIKGKKEDLLKKIKMNKLKQDRKEIR